MQDSLGDRMKFYESLGMPDRLSPLLPIVVRLDGVAFHTFTKGLKRPYDERMSNLMVDTTKYLVKETNAICGYTQSDEITLLLYADNFETQVYFDGRLQKILSVLPARASVYFNAHLNAMPEKMDQSPVFDCRVFTVPTKEEAVNVLVWREQDATRNSISMAAQSLYSHNELQNKSCSDMQELIFQKGVNWNDYPDFFKKGTYIQRQRVERPFSSEEIEKLPEKHAARNDPALKILRTNYVTLIMPPITKVSNRVDVIFNGAEPKEFVTRNS